MAKAKKRNPQDATLRNITAGKRRTTILEMRVSQLQGRIGELEVTVKALKDLVYGNELYGRAPELEGANKVASGG